MCVRLAIWGNREVALFLCSLDLFFFFLQKNINYFWLMSIFSVLHINLGVRRCFSTLNFGVRRYFNVLNLGVVRFLSKNICIYHLFLVPLQRLLKSFNYGAHFSTQDLSRNAFLEARYGWSVRTSN